eukprot:1757115-Pyramimonas_sp.AAC.1
MGVGQVRRVEDQAYQRLRPNKERHSPFGYNLANLLTDLTTRHRNDSHNMRNRSGTDDIQLLLLTTSSDDHLLGVPTVTRLAFFRQARLLADWLVDEDPIEDLLTDWPLNPLATLTRAPRLAPTRGARVHLRFAAYSEHFFAHHAVVEVQLLKLADLEHHLEVPVVVVHIRGQDGAADHLAQHAAAPVCEAVQDVCVPAQCHLPPATPPSERDVRERCKLISVKFSGS